MPSIAAALHDLLGSNDLTVEQAVARHVTDDYRQSTDGVWIDRAAYVQQIAQLRGFIERIAVEVKGELTEGSHYAERHIITVTRRDGGTAAQEVFLFGEVAADGRFAQLEELTRQLP
ncbi:hypothetical protein GCM10022288_22130 [Gryllotalpicola kribbensis]|jgi:hypothetical protein|uniref:Nuclear transport factor 2 family protein n=1 Tax=Gryllotalpicola kribbensis TaxID=993084 RepID=A0ABP8AVZ2_9MICO